MKNDEKKVEKKESWIKRTYKKIDENKVIRTTHKVLMTCLTIANTATLIWCFGSAYKESMSNSDSTQMTNEMEVKPQVTEIA